MSWFQRHGSSSSSSSEAPKDITDKQFGGSISDLFCITEEVEETICETKPVKGGKFSRKCEKSKEIGRHCLGKPYRVVQTTNTVYPEEELTSLPEQDEEKPPTLSVKVFGIDVGPIQGQMKSLLGAEEEMKSSISKRGSAERK